MLWRLSEKKLLIKTQTHEISEYLHYFHSEEATNLLQKGIFRNIGSFCEAEIYENSESEETFINKFSNSVFRIEDERYLKVGNCLLGEVIRTFGTRVVSSLEDFLYLSNIYVIEEDEFVEYLFSEKSYQGFFGKLNRTVIYGDLENLSRQVKT